MKKQLNCRKASGLSITVLLAFITFFVIGPMSMLVYEIARYNLASQQLKYCADSAALTAAASTTGANSPVMTTVMTTAMNQAAYMFAQNSILDKSLSGTPTYTYGTATPVMTPAANQAQLYFQFLDPVTKQPVAYGAANGKILQCTAAFGYSPVSSKFTHIAAGPFVITQTSDGGLPQLDVVLCFDISASMDDFTNVTLVNRYRNGTSNTATNLYSMATPYSVVATNNGVSYYSAQGPLYYAINCSQNTGTALNATWPIQFECCGTSPVNYQSTFSSANHGTNNGAVPPITSKPGNYVFTDMVVNVDGTTNMSAGITTTANGNTFTFPKADATGMPYGILVEAARGNLESSTVATAAGIDTSSAGFKKYSGFAFQAGWFQAYYTLAMQIPSVANTTSTTIPIRRPIGDAIMAARSFFSILNNNADVHFGLVTFSDSAGQSATDTVTSTDSIGYEVAGSPGYQTIISPQGYPGYSTIAAPNPSIFLNPNPGSAYSNYDTSASPASTSVNGCIYYNTSTASTNFGINSLLAEGGTNISDALDLALSMELGSHASDPSSTNYGKKNLSRPGATRALVLFTDGLPTAGGDSATNWPNSVAEAKIAKSAGIPIYTIGLCLVSSLQSSQIAVLSDDTTNYPNGIAGLSGNNSTFAQTTDATQLTAIFQNVARQLVQLVRTN
ncbi:MAG: VWA domain-containing protein [Candidatus Obscuribacterales bacterium]|nr:VWA domain-containing protein [Candidatus Obscuribacterales bacterium]